jgi:Tfp pilus assembly protein PilZ
VEITLGQRSQRMRALVAWVNAGELYGKPRGFGVSFTKRQPGVRKAAVALHKKSSRAS